MRDAWWGEASWLDKEGGGGVGCLTIEQTLRAWGHRARLWVDVATAQHRPGRRVAVVGTAAAVRRRGVRAIAAAGRNTARLRSGVLYYRGRRQL